MSLASTSYKISGDLLHFLSGCEATTEEFPATLPVLDTEEVIVTPNIVKNVEPVPDVDNLPARNPVTEMDLERGAEVDDNKVTG